MKKIAILILLFCYDVSMADEIKPFTTDGCSLSPDGDIANNVKWMDCCVRHDYAYWKGGTREQRRIADLQLKQCVSELGEKDISLIMHLGVRLGGDPYFPTWYRWGYGWSYFRGYQALSDEEEAQARQRIVEFTLLLNSFLESETGLKPERSKP